MRSDVINLIHRGADSLTSEDDGGAAYALHEVANNLRLLMRGEATMEEWNKIYVGQDRPAMDIDAHMPPIDETVQDPEDLEDPRMR